MKTHRLVPIDISVDVYGYQSFILNYLYAVLNVLRESLELLFCCYILTTELVSQVTYKGYLTNIC